MSNADVERVHYYQRQYLGAVDFLAEQAYHRDMRRRHNIGQHTWGIVVGLELVEIPQEGGGDGRDVYLQPGMAVDGFGREILVAFPHRLDAALFDRFIGAALHHEVWIAYDEERARRPAAGYELCEGEEQFGRVRETFRFFIDPKPPDQVPVPDTVDVGGKAVGVPPPPQQPPAAQSPGTLFIPGDKSIPYQDFPDDPATPRWMIRLGSVQWDPATKRFIAAASGKLGEGRQYAGAVAASVLSPASTLTLARRFPETDKDASDFGFVEGRLEVLGRLTARKDVIAKADVQIHGGRLSFLKSDGTDGGAPLWMQRRNGAKNDLRVHIGDKSEDKTRLTIGPLDAGAEKDVLVVKADNNVEIPTGELHFGEKTRQMVNLWKKNYGMGVQSDTLYWRSDNDFCWFRQGVHADGRSDPGGGGTLQLRLDQDARLHFGARTRQMLNLWQESYGVGVQSSTLYFRTASDFCWFRGGSHHDAQSNPGGGSLQMKLDTAGDLTVNGGDVILNGGVVEFRDAAGGDNTDVFQLTRHNRAFNHSDLRVVLGDDNDGNDRFIIGPKVYPSGNYLQNFIVKNNGDLVIAGGLYLGDSKKLPVDVASGEVYINKQGTDSGTYYLTVSSRLSYASAANLLVALSDIQNYDHAVWARWRVRAGTGIRVSNDTFMFPVYWQVDDIDGFLRAFSWVVIFSP